VIREDGTGFVVEAERGHLRENLVALAHAFTTVTGSSRTRGSQGGFDGTIEASRRSASEPRSSAARERQRCRP
jgi:hypothetical protein